MTSPTAFNKGAPAQGIQADSSGNSARHLVVKSLWFNKDLKREAFRRRNSRLSRLAFRSRPTKLSPMSRVSRLGFIQPQLPTLTAQPPAGDRWIHEIKHDGYRTVLVVDRGSVRAFTRNGHDWSDRYPAIVASAAELRCRSAILDGEVIVQDGRGASDFEALQRALRGRRNPLIFYAFDILHLDGNDLRALPLVERRAKLKKLIGDEGAGAVQFSEEFIGDAAALFRACAKHQLEGIVSKLASSRYRSGRTRSWLKTSALPRAS